MNAQVGAVDEDGDLAEVFPLQLGRCAAGSTWKIISTVHSSHTTESGHEEDTVARDVVPLSAETLEQNNYRAEENEKRDVWMSEHWWFVSAEGLRLKGDSVKATF